MPTTNSKKIKATDDSRSHLSRSGRISASDESHAGTSRPDIYPSGTQYRLCSVAMALQGAAELFNEVMDGSDKDCGVAGILDLAVAELTRINSELEASRGK